MKLLDHIASPGSALGGGMKAGAGDDRFALDEAAGWACVIDGATDVGPIRLFRDGESDAARFADILASLLTSSPAGPDETPQDYFARLLPMLRAAVEREARFALKDAPRSSYPTAAATWVRARDGCMEAATLGDSIAIAQTPDGRVSVMGEATKPAEEQARARRVMGLSQDERRKWLQNVRALHNTQDGYWVFGVQPEAAARIIHQGVEAPPGTKALLMTDGFYRLVSPYRRYDEAQLIKASASRGLGALLSELRALEADPADDAEIGRFKTSDDATALLIEV